MNIECPSLISVGVLLIVGLLATAVPTLLLGTVNWHRALELLLWATTTLFAATALFWVLLTYVIGAGYEPTDSVLGGEEIQVRILTIDAVEVVQATVDSLPAELDDVRVIAEESIDVDGATVHVVPNSLDCEAVRKGRSIEWARRTLDTDREFILYLDEDCHLESFAGLPDADIVQLREQLRHTESGLSYLADVYRMVVQIEQRSFARLSIPLFGWGGGIAVRQSVEDTVTWNRETLVEDTAFVWAAARELSPTFELPGRPVGMRRPRLERFFSSAVAGQPATSKRRENCPLDISYSYGCVTTHGRCPRS